MAYTASEEEPNGEIRQNVEGDWPSPNIYDGGAKDEQTAGGGSEGATDSTAEVSVIGQGETVSLLVPSTSGSHDEGDNVHVSLLIEVDTFF